MWSLFVRIGQNEQDGNKESMHLMDKAFWGVGLSGADCPAYVHKRTQTCTWIGSLNKQKENWINRPLSL